MIGLVVTGHGHFADGIHTSAQMIAGENDYVRYINFEEGMTPEQLAEKFNAAFDEFKSCDGVVVLSDLPGGSPFKTAVECKYARPEQKIEVIAGTNLPMIVTAVTMLDMEDDPRSLADEQRVPFPGRDARLVHPFAQLPVYPPPGRTEAVAGLTAAQPQNRTYRVYFSIICLIF